MNTPTQSERVLQFLREHKDPTVIDISRGVSPWIANPWARIGDLRKAGYVIECVKRPDGHNGFRLIEEQQRTLGLTA